MGQAPIGTIFGTVPQWLQITGTDQQKKEGVVPAFNLIVNPYDPGNLYITGSSAIFSSSNSGVDWIEESILGSIATNNGEFRYGCGQNFDPSANGGGTIFVDSCALNFIAFDAYRPEIRLAVTFPGGIAFSRDHGSHWIDLGVTNVAVNEGKVDGPVLCRVKQDIAVEQAV